LLVYFIDTFLRFEELVSKETDLRICKWSKRLALVGGKFCQSQILLPKDKKLSNFAS
jgi:hypothetical protein